MNYNFDYSEEKNLILKVTRGVGFEDIIEAIEKGNVLDDIGHFNRKKYPNQKIFIVRIRDKVYAVPYVFDEIKKVLFFP